MYDYHMMAGSSHCHGHPVQFRQIEDFRHFPHFQIEDLDFAHYILNPAVSLHPPCMDGHDSGAGAGIGEPAIMYVFYFFW